MFTASLLPEYRLRRRETGIVLDDFLMKVHPGLQTFKIHAARKNTIITRSGAKITIPPFAMRTVLGQIVNREVEFCLLENISPAEMIASNRPSTSKGQLLNSIWQLDMNVTHDGLSVQLCKPIVVEVPLPQPMSQLKVFKGCKASIRAYGSDQQSDWQVCPKIPISQVAGNRAYYARFSLSGLNWYTLGRIHESKKTQGRMLSVCLKEGIRAYDEVRAFLVHPDANSTAYLYKGLNDFKGINVPDKEETIAVALACRDERYYLGAARRREDGQKIMVTHMVAVEGEHFLARLSALCSG